jgi:FkbM family methyltransferase
MLKKILRSFGYSLKKIRRSDEEADVLFMALQLIQPTLVLDCGANQGAFARACRASSYSGPIWCFDPNLQCVDILETFAKEDRGIRVFAMGIGEQNGAMELQVAGSDGNMGSLLPQQPWLTERFRSAGVRDRYEVPVKRLDEVLDEEGVSSDERIFLKLDTQGYDCAAYRGMGDRQRQVVAVKAEFAVQPIYQGAPLHWEMQDLLREQGFEPFWFSVVSRGFDGRLIEYDSYYVKTS